MEWLYICVISDPVDGDDDVDDDEPQEVVLTDEDEDPLVLAEIARREIEQTGNESCLTIIRSVTNNTSWGNELYVMM